MTAHASHPRRGPRRTQAGQARRRAVARLAPWLPDAACSALAVLVVVAAASPAPAAAQDAPAAALAPELVHWRSCRAQAEALAARLDSLVALEVVAWEQRRRAIATDARAQELQALARGEALGDAIRAVADGLREREGECDRIGEALLARVEREIAAPRAGPATGARMDSLEQLRRGLIEARAARRDADLTPPIARPDDGPDVLRVKALRARDLADRAAAWRADVVALHRSWEDRARLAQERRALLGDLSFFDAGAALSEGGAWSPPDATDPTVPADGSAVGRLLQAMLTPGGLVVEEQAPAAVFAALESWLQQRERDLWQRAAELDSLAGQWGREP